MFNIILDSKITNIKGYFTFLSTDELKYTKTLIYDKYAIFNISTPNDYYCKYNSIKKLNIPKILNFLKRNAEQIYVITREDNHNDINYLLKSFNKIHLVDNYYDIDNWIRVTILDKYYIHFRNKLFKKNPFVIVNNYDYNYECLPKIVINVKKLTIEYSDLHIDKFDYLNILKYLKNNQRLILDHWNGTRSEEEILKCLT
jgi:hypothetical protein